MSPPDDEIVRALLDPATYPHRPASVEHLQTHLSHVFVAPPFAYKLKKAVRFSFVDLTSAALRRRDCFEEVRLNRRLCAPIYLGVVPIVRDATGRPSLGAPHTESADFVAATPADGDRTIDDLVWMRALPAEGMAERALAEGRIQPRHIATLARRIAAFHATLPPEPASSPEASTAALLERWNQVIADCAPMIGSLIAAEDAEVLSDFGALFFARHASLLAARAEAGRTREGHGDLHVGNLCLVEDELPPVEGAPVVPAGLWPFDCLEFARALRVNDVASEVAFLAMDLEARGRSDLAEVFTRTYVEASGDADLRILLPLYTCHRATIRGMVLGLKSADDGVPPPERDEAAARARAHFSLAVRHAWAAAGPAMIACTGLSGSGKSTVATALAETTGFDLVSSDEIRKRRAGMDVHEATPPDLRDEMYAPDARRAVYAALAARVGADLAAGRGVVADATFIRRRDRDLVAGAASATGSPHVFLVCAADEATVRERIEARSREAPAPGSGTAPARSDADWSVHQMQRGEQEPPGADEPALRIDTGRTRAETRATAIRAAWAWRRTHPVRD